MCANSFRWWVLRGICWLRFGGLSALVRRRVLRKRSLNPRRFCVDRRSFMFRVFAFHCVFDFDCVFDLRSHECDFRMLITRVICRVRFVLLCRCGFREFVPNSRRHVILCLGVHCLLFELRFDVGSGNLKTSTSPPRSKPG